MVGRETEVAVVNPLIELTTEECLSLMTTRTAGRIALQTPGGLRIFPVNYALFGDAVVFRTLPYGEIANNAHELGGRLPGRRARPRPTAAAGACSPTGPPAASTTPAR